MKALVEDLLGRVAPRWLWARRIRQWRIETGEAEQELLPWLCDRAKTSIDIGAADGTYIPRLLLYSAGVIAFEPRPPAAAELQRIYRNMRQVRIESVALSSTSGTVEMRVPVNRPMLSTIDAANSLEEIEGATVETVQRKRLDDYAIDTVGFVKIDVEGHEDAVLQGAHDTLARTRPRVLIEAEERHRPGATAGVASFFQSLNYSGFFLLAGRLRPISEFEPATHQNAAQLDAEGRRVGTYINNFVFLPVEDIGSVPSSYQAPPTR